MEYLELQFECGCTYIEGFNVFDFVNDYLKKTKQSKDFKIHCRPYHKGETEF